MKTSIKLKIVLLILVTLGISCKDEILVSGSDNSFYPLKVGNVWEYNIVQYDSLGTVEYEGTFEEKIISDTIINGQLLFEIESPEYRDPACCDYKFYFENKLDGIYLLIYSPLILIRNNHIYKYPCREGEIFSVNNIYNDSIFVISTQDTVISEAGAFNCIVYKSIVKDVTIPEEPILGYIYIYVSPGIGKIKLESYSINSNQQLIKTFVYTLKNYVL
jgi:hypothetical protein